MCCVCKPLVPCVDYTLCSVAIDPKTAHVPCLHLYLGKTKGIYGEKLWSFFFIHFFYFFNCSKDCRTFNSLIDEDAIPRCISFTFWYLNFNCPKGNNACTCRPGSNKVATNSDVIGSQFVRSDFLGHPCTCRLA